MKTQTDSPMKANAALEIIRGLPGARLQVPRDGYPHKRAIAVALGADHLDKPESELVVEEEKDDKSEPRIDEMAELDKYVDLIHELAEDQQLISFEKPVSLGHGGTIQEEVVEFDIVYTATSNRAIVLFGPIRSAEDLLAFIKRKGSVRYRTRFERGQRGFLCELPKVCKEDPSLTDTLLGFVDELREAGRLEEKVDPFLDFQRGSKGEVIRDLPAAKHILRAL